MNTSEYKNDIDIYKKGRPKEEYLAIWLEVLSVIAGNLTWLFIISFIITLIVGVIWTIATLPYLDFCLPRIR